MNTNNRLLIFIVFSLLLLPFKLMAHSFDIAVIAPFSSENVNKGMEFWNGMRVATRERDGHANETSDGHLGGVDSQLLKLDTAQSKASISKKLVNIGAKQGFIIAVLIPGHDDFISTIPTDIPYIAIVNNTGQESFSKENTDQNGAILNKSNPNILVPKLAGERIKDSFRQSYMQQYNQLPGELAFAGYAAARLIDAAIRQTDGDFTHSKEVQNAFIEAIRLIEEIK